MNFGNFHPRGRRNNERGYMLIVLMLAAAIMLIAMTGWVTNYRTQIKRDREVEMIHRGVAYARAVQRYYKKFGNYPTTIEQLESTNKLRFLRKRYTDPMSPDGKWRVLHQGDVKLGNNSTGLTPSSGMSSSSNTTASNTAATTTGTQTGTLGDTGTATANTGGSDTSGALPGGIPIFGSSSSPGVTATPAGSNVSTTGSDNKTFGGGPIIGVASLKNAKGIHRFAEKDNYRDWLFIYDPSQDQGKGVLISGPYNPKAFVGQYGSTTNTSSSNSSGSTPTSTGSSNALGNSSGTQSTGAATSGATQQ